MVWREDEMLITRLGDHTPVIIVRNKLSSWFNNYSPISSCSSRMISTSPTDSSNQISLEFETKGFGITKNLVLIIQQARLAWRTETVLDLNGILIASSSIQDLHCQIPFSHGKERKGGGWETKRQRQRERGRETKREREGVRHKTGLTLVRVKIPVGTGTCVSLGFTVSERQQQSIAKKLQW